MKNWQKKTLWTIGISSVIWLAFMIALLIMFDAERLKNMARETARESWSRELSIGALSLRLLPFPKLHAENVSLKNPSWAKNKHLLQASSVTADLALLPLLRRSVSVKSLSIDGLKAHLEVSPEDFKSWDLNNAAGLQDKSASGSANLGFLSLHSVRIRNVDISYQNRGKEAATWHVDDIRGKGRTGLRDIHIDARLSHNTHPMQIQAKFDDLSRLGEQAALSQGSIELRWESSKLTMDGMIPLEASLQGHDLKASFSSESFADILAFFDIEGLQTGPLKIDAKLIESQGKITASDLEIRLGKLTASGTAQLVLSGPKPMVDIRLAADQLNWSQMLRDAGRPPPPPKSPDELFHTHPLAWKFLLTLQTVGGSADLQIATLKLRSGIELKNAKAKINLKGDQLNMTALSAELLGGSMSGNMQLNGNKKSVHLNLDAIDWSLEKWFAERGRKIAFTGGPMKIKASVSASGSSMKDLAASLTGPVSITMGPGVILSEKAGEAETLLIGMFAGSEADRINLKCVGAQLPFNAGRATAAPIVGARSDTSHLLTAGSIDLKEQVLDLRGRVRAASGVSLGMSTMAGDVRIAGKLNRPEFGMDPAGAPEVLARLGAAIVTGGASILGTAIWDAANTKGDPCAIASAAKKTSTP